MSTQKQELYTEYLADVDRRGKSRKHIVYALKIFFAYCDEGGIGLLRVRLRHVQDFQLYLTTSINEDGSIRFTRASVLNIVGSVSNFYEHLRRRKHLHANPFAELDRVRRSDALPRNILNEERMDTFLKHLKDFMKGSTLTEKRKLYRAHVLAELLYSTGARINEIASLTPTDCDFDRGVVILRDSKTGKSREAILNSFAARVLEIYLHRMRLYLLSGHEHAHKSLLFGSKVHLRTWCNEILNRESQKLKLGKFTTHNFRHAVGYHLLRGGCDIRFIQEILGHDALNSTQVYTKVDKEDLKNVIDEYHPRKMKPQRRGDTEEEDSEKS